jgi:hypothetical protein
MVRNPNWNATGRIDHGLIVENVTLDARAIQEPGSFHSIAFRMARRIRINNVTCLGGGDCTAFEGDVDTAIGNSRAVGMANACWDHWESSSSVRVINTSCDTNLYGILFTGTNTAENDPGVAKGGVFSYNRLLVRGHAGAALWLNGLGPFGSGSSSVVVAHNDISACHEGNVGIKISGSSSEIAILNNLISGKTFGQGIVVSNDSGGRPSNVVLVANVVDGLIAKPIDVAPISVGGDNVIVSGNFVYGSFRSPAYWLHGNHQKARQNSFNGNYGANIYETSGAKNLTINLDKLGGPADPPIHEGQVNIGSAARSNTGRPDNCL